MKLQRVPLMLAAVALAAMAVCLYATGRGVGLFTDSKAYLGAAQSLLEGRGYTVPSPTGAPEPLTNWPPLFSILLAGLGSVGTSLRAAARWLNVALLGATIFLTGLAIRRVSGSTCVALLGCLLLGTSRDVLGAYAQAGSDPLFIFFGLLGLFLLGVYANEPRPRYLIGAAAAVGLAFLSRYAGVALVLTGALALLRVGRSAWRRRVKDTLVFTALSCVPMALFIVRNSLLVSEPLGGLRTLMFHPLHGDQVKLALDTMWGWLVPDRNLAGSPAVLIGRLPHLRWIILSTAAVVGPIATLQRLWRAHRSSEWRVVVEPLWEPPLLGFLLTYVFVYLGFLIVSVTFLDADIELGPRILSPALIASLIVGLGLGYRGLGQLRRSPLIVGTAIAAAGLVMTSYAHAGVVWIRRAHEEGLGYAARVWQQSDILHKVAALPAGVLIYSNGAEPLTLLTGRPAADVPYKFDPSAARPNPDYERLLDTIRARLRTGGVVVYLKRAAWPGCPCAPEAELKDRLHLQLQAAATDGSIYQPAREEYARLNEPRASDVAERGGR